MRSPIKGEGAKKRLSRKFCGRVGAKQIKQVERKRYWPNTRTINRLIMGELVVSKNQQTRKVKLESEESKNHAAEFRKNAEMGGISSGGSRIFPGGAEN